MSTAQPFHRVSSAPPIPRYLVPEFVSDTSDSKLSTASPLSLHALTNLVLLFNQTFFFGGITPCCSARGIGDEIVPVGYDTLVGNYLNTVQNVFFFLFLDGIFVCWKDTWNGTVLDGVI